MFKSIFKRLLFTYAFIIIVVILLLAAIMTYFFNLYLFHQKQEQLLNAGQQVTELARQYHSKKIGKNQLTLTVNSLATVTDSRINLLLDKKLLELKSRNDQQQEEKRRINVAGDIKQILEGKTIVRKKFFSNELNTYVIYIGMPVYINDEINGVILLISPMENVNKTLIEVNTIIWGTAATSVALAAIIIYFISRRISKPIETIRNSASLIAAGNFSGDIETVGKDELAQLTSTFNFMKNRLRQIEEMRKDLIGNVSHELRTPLTSIRGFIQAILEGVIKPEEQHRFLQRAYEETGRLNRLVEDLLQLAKLQSDSLSLNKEFLVMKELINEILEENELLAKQRQICLTAEISQENTLVLADRDKLKQIILNLVHNAINYSGEGSQVWIRSNYEHKTLIVTVEDNGKGIPEEHLQLIFEKFHRLDKSRSRHTAGTGLGLSIAKGLVELHGGNISVRSQTGYGTQFTFTIPDQE